MLMATLPSPHNLLHTKSVEESVSAIALALKRWTDSATAIEIAREQVQLELDSQAKLHINTLPCLCENDENAS